MSTIRKTNYSLPITITSSDVSSAFHQRMQFAHGFGRLGKQQILTFRCGQHCEGPVVLFLVAGEEESSKTERMKQMIVFKVQMACGKSRVKARTVVAKTCGVNFLELQGDDVIVVAGDGIDAACLTYSLRKKVGHTDIICMTPLE
uniref:HMA domain-containing protein n=1 Tax=Salix viminalis TaxID=40686 RepID=A0A6N2K3Q3_SALVM